MKPNPHQDLADWLGKIESLAEAVQAWETAVGQNVFDPVLGELERQVGLRVLALAGAHARHRTAQAAKQTAAKALRGGVR